MGTQNQHLIPLNVIRDHQMFKAMRASGFTFNGFLLKLPDKASAAAAAATAQAGDIADAAHEGRHYKAYDRMVSAYLTRFQAVYAES
jgi:A nuclease family of the HNH/ENDO VII superfamily with conserved AHH